MANNYKLTRSQWVAELEALKFRHLPPFWRWRHTGANGRVEVELLVSSAHIQVQPKEGQPTTTLLHFRTRTTAQFTEALARAMAEVSRG